VADHSAGAAGVDFWWLDWQQEKFTRSIPDLPNLRWLNYLYFEHTRRHGRRGCSFSRWAGWGDHRHPVHFSGDAHTGWESLAFQVPFTAVAGNVGCFFWSHDIGGHFGPRLEEATTRWVQFGALSPVLRLHSARSGSLDRRPWAYKPVYEEAMRAAFALRAELFPYIYSMARKCHTEMLPLCRPMYIDWPEEEAAYENPQQYMLGDSLLVAPITSPGVGARKVATQAVWFPDYRGASVHQELVGGRMRAEHCWYNWNTGEKYWAGNHKLVAAEIDEVPLFAPGGVPVVTRGGEPTLRMATDPLEEIVIVCYPGEPGTSFETDLYEDDGISAAHARGEHATTRVRVRWLENEVKVEVSARTGHYAGAGDTRRVAFELRGLESTSKSTINDIDATPSMNTNRARLTSAEVHAGDALVFTMQFTPTRAELANVYALERRLHSIEGAEGRDAALRSFSPAQRAQFQALFGIGFRLDGEMIDLYDLGDASFDLVEMVGDTVVSTQHLADSLRAARHKRLRLPPPTARPLLGHVARRLILIRPFSNEERVERLPLSEASEYLRTFRVLGPFRYDPTKPMHAQRHGPELVPARERVGKQFIDMNGVPRSWVEAPPGEFWPQSIRQICGGHNGEAMAYALTHIWSPEEQEVTLLLESGDRLELWLGDDRAFSSDDEGRESEATVDEVRVTLRKGWNQIMGKTNEGGGGWGFRVAVDGKFELRESFDMR
jgi:hypothetical protein